MTRIRLSITYNGTNYYGWQKQLKLPSVQAAIEQALQAIFKQKIHIVGASRTDTGTHAIMQTAHFDLKDPLPKKLSIIKALNHYLPKDIRVRKAWQVAKSFHALNSVCAKTYIYYILNRNIMNVFLQDRIYWHPYPINLNSLQKMSECIIGTHDFKSFQNAGSSVQHSMRTIYQAKWLKTHKNIFAFIIKGNGFLKQMVRNLVGTQLSLLTKYPNQSKIIKKWQIILQAKDRKAALKTAPAHGLYPSKLDRKCLKI